MMNNIEIVTAGNKHFSFLKEHDLHITNTILKRKLENNEILIMELNDTSIGWLRFSLFWDEIPFMNMLYVLSDYRRKGYGKMLVNHWENLLIEKGYTRFLTSTLANEDAQHFYRKIGYTDVGGFVLPLEPLEILLIKDIKQSAT